VGSLSVTASFSFLLRFYTVTLNMRRLFFVHILCYLILSCNIMAAGASSTCVVPPEAQQEDTSAPDTIVGDGIPESCTSAAFVEAVATGGIITFDCGPDPITITLSETAKVFNNTALPDIVIDGGDKVTLSGGGVVRILYMNTCDPNQVWTTPHCQNQDHPRLTVQNLTFEDGNATGLANDTDPGGGGAIFVRGGRFKAVHSRFINNMCDSTGPDVGGAAIRVFSQYNNQPVYINDSVFGGAEGLGNICSNGGGLSSIGVSYSVINSLFSHNSAIGYGANPAKPGTPGGGSGGAIYNDGNTFTLSLCGTAIHDNTANEGGSAIFFVSNDLSGTMQIENSALWSNPKGTFETTGYPGIFYLGDGDIQLINSTIGEDATPSYIAVDVDGDSKIGLAEIVYILQTVSESGPQEYSGYVRKKGDIVYDHNVDILDAVAGLKLLID
jgi:hypothetical protein